MAESFFSGPDFNKIFSKEMRDWIGIRRKHQPDGSDIPQPDRPTVENDLFGLALSGGGMRSATFALGVTQALAEQDVLDRLDYASSVSGGGYMLTGAYSHAADSAPEKRGFGSDKYPFRSSNVGDDRPKDAYTDNPAETHATYQARRNAKMLIPDLGITNSEVWAAAAYYLLKTALLWSLYLLPVVLLLTMVSMQMVGRAENELAGRVDVGLLDSESIQTLIDEIQENGTLPQSLSDVEIASSGLLKSATTDAEKEIELDAAAAEITEGATLDYDLRELLNTDGVPFSQLEDDQIVELIERLQLRGVGEYSADESGPITLRLSTVSHGYWDRIDPFADFYFRGFSDGNDGRTLASDVVLVGIVAIAVAVVFGAARAIGMMSVSSGVIDYRTNPHQEVEIKRPRRAFSSLTGFVAKLAGITIMLVAGVLVIQLVIWGYEMLFAPSSYRPGHGDSPISIAWTALLTGGGIATLSTLVRSLSKNANPDSKDGKGGKLSLLLLPLEKLSGVLLLAAVAGGIYVLIWVKEFDRVGGPDVSIPGWLIVASFALLAIGALFGPLGPRFVSRPGRLRFSFELSYRNGILNSTSLYGMYRRRLRRTWMSNSNDYRLVELPELLSEHVPYPIINGALSITGGTNSDTLNRKGEPFILSPFFVGSRLNGWSSTESRFSDMSLSEANAISASAFAPNIGNMQKPIVGPALTLLNLRLGRWVPHPSGFFADTRVEHDSWEPSLIRPIKKAFSYLTTYWRDMFGIASHKDSFVFVADGGHFENSGAYELLRRRNKFIIYVDEAGDTAPPNRQNFGGLSNLVRMARIDLGIDINVDLEHVMRGEDELDAATYGRSNSYLAFGTIHYPAATPTDDEEIGYFLYIKGTLTVDPLPADILNYVQTRNPTFPNDSTADQQYDEAQFESYRKLGVLAGEAAIERIGKGGDDISVWRERTGISRKHSDS